MSLAIQWILAVIVAFLPPHVGLPIAIAWIVWGLLNAIDPPPSKVLRPAKPLPRNPPINLTTPYFITTVIILFGWPVLVLAYFLLLRPSA